MVDAAGGRIEKSPIRIGVMSDSHGNLKSIRQGIKKMGEIAMLLHAGDHCGDIAAAGSAVSIPVRAVRGNCDFGGRSPGQMMLECAGKKILLLHGHRYNVKRTYALLVAYAQTLGPDLVIFGHTHVPALFSAGTTLFFNPGSLAYPRSEDPPSCGIIEICGDSLVPQLLPLQPAIKIRRFF
ncbi:MAG: metallophosphoesterase family protein [bacterium]